MERILVMGGERRGVGGEGGGDLCHCTPGDLQ